MRPGTTIVCKHSPCMNLSGSYPEALSGKYISINPTFRVQGQGRHYQLVLATLLAEPVLPTYNKYCSSAGTAPLYELPYFIYSPSATVLLTNIMSYSTQRNTEHREKTEAVR